MTLKTPQKINNVFAGIAWSACSASCGASRRACAYHANTMPLWPYHSASCAASRRACAYYLFISLPFVLHHTSWQWSLPPLVLNAAKASGCEMRVFTRHLTAAIGAGWKNGETHDSNRGLSFAWVLFWHFSRFLNRNAYIEIAINGNSFCTSAMRAFKLLMRNALRVAAINSIGDFVLNVAKLVIILTCTIGTFFWFRNYDDG